MQISSSVFTGEKVTAVLSYLTCSSVKLKRSCAERVNVGRAGDKLNGVNVTGYRECNTL